MHSGSPGPDAAAANLPIMRRKAKDPDQRIEDLLPLVKGLPPEQRHNLADFLEALLEAHRLVEKPKKS